LDLSEDFKSLLYTDIGVWIDLRYEEILFVYSNFFLNEEVAEILPGTTFPHNQSQIAWKVRFAG
jgi:hypothetical protein